LAIVLLLLNKRYFARNCRRAIVTRAIVGSRYCRRAIVGEQLSCALKTGHL